MITYSLNFKLWQEAFAPGKDALESLEHAEKEALKLFGKLVADYEFEDMKRDSQTIVQSLINQFRSVVKEDEVTTSDIKM